MTEAVRALLTIIPLRSRGHLFHCLLIFVRDGHLFLHLSEVSFNYNQSFASSLVTHVVFGSMTIRSKLQWMSYGTKCYTNTGYKPEINNEGFVRLIDTSIRPFSSHLPTALVVYINQPPTSRKCSEITVT